MAEKSLPTQDRVDAYFKELNNWGRWGHDDQLGTLNMITRGQAGRGAGADQEGPHRVARARRRAAARVHVPHDLPRQAGAGQRRARPLRHGLPRLLDHPRRRALPRRLGRRALQRPPVRREPHHRGRAVVPHRSDLHQGITTRGVLLDVAAARPEGFVTVGKPVTPKELDEVARRAGVKVGPGDVVVLRSGDEALPPRQPRLGARACRRIPAFTCRASSGSRRRTSPGSRGT